MNTGKIEDMQRYHLDSVALKVNLLRKEFLEFDLSHE